MYKTYTENFPKIAVIQDNNGYLLYSIAGTVNNSSFIIFNLEYYFHT